MVLVRKEREPVPLPTVIVFPPAVIVNPTVAVMPVFIMVAALVFVFDAIVSPEGDIVNCSVIEPAEFTKLNPILEVRLACVAVLQ